jgi:predicted MFS family arabinose efflux permease
MPEIRDARRSGDSRSLAPTTGIEQAVGDNDRERDRGAPRGLVRGGAPRGLVRGGAPRGLVRVMAFASGAIVANLYYAQPLLQAVASGLHVSQSVASLLVTVTQLGYAAGLLFLVPVADIVRRRPLFTTLLIAVTIALAGSAAAPGIAVLGALALVIGITSVVVQMLVPFAATLAADHERSHVIGAMMGGILTGILLSRTFAGIVSEFLGWRGVYGIAAVLMAVTTVVLYREMPERGREVSTTYGAQLRAVLGVAWSEPVLRWRALTGACGFAGFSAFWTTVPFLLSARYGFSELEVGLFALAGAAGALASAKGGRHLDARPRLRWPATGALLAGQIAFYLLMLAGSAGPEWSGLTLLVIGVLGMDAAVQSANLTNQSVVYELLPTARARLTSVYMTTMFVGGAVGSLAGAHAYARWGWPGAVGACGVFPALGLVAWLGSRRHEVFTSRPGRD